MPRKAPHPGDLMKVIRLLAADGAVSFTKHAFERSDERGGIDMLDVLAVLRNGRIKGNIVAGPGEWKCKVVDKLEGSSRSIGVVVVIEPQGRLLILTVEWEDA